VPHLPDDPEFGWAEPGWSMMAAMRFHHELSYDAPPSRVKEH
jgi:hypothetical protein